MATPEETRIRNWLSRAASRLGSAAIWPATRRVLKAKEDYIFEFYCFLRMVRDLQINFRVDYVPGAGVNQHCFPRKPANKQDRPRFDIYDKASGKLLWQFCLGTKIRDRNGRERAPDMSLQAASAAPNSPVCSDVRLVWDAKFKGSPAQRLTDADLATFAHMVEFFDLRGGAIPPVRFDRLMDLACNGLISNGTRSTETDAGLIQFSVKEIEGFFPGRNHQARP